LSGVFTGAPTVIGHRGLGAGEVQGCVENTLPSFLAAARSGVDWLEVDVRRTADDGLVVMHDPAWDDGTFVVDVALDQARRRGALVLADLLAALPGRVGVDFDLKTSMEDAVRPRPATTAALLAPLAARVGRSRPVAVTSFDPAALGTLRTLAPGVPVGLLTWLRFPAGIAVSAAAHLDVDFLAVHVGSLLPNRVEPAPQQRPHDYVIDLVHRAGREFLAWCPEPEVAVELVAAGADAVCVNDVPAALGRLRP
jgi:glycerophosphoryl diester phosphodiesterase